MSLEFAGAAAIHEGIAALAGRASPVVFPNPVRGEARILPGRAIPGSPAVDERIAIVDLTGRVIRRFDNVNAGGVLWDGRGEDGRPAAAGMYLVRGREGRAATRVVLLRP